MRESFGSTWTMQLVFSFTLLFVAFLAVTISYSRSFKVRNEVISIIEKYGGYTKGVVGENNGSVDIINDYVRNSGYRNMGKCDVNTGHEIIGIKSLEPFEMEKASSNTKYYYCIRRDKANTISVSDVIYEVTMFYKFNIPIFGNIATFTVKGKSTDLVKRNDVFSQMFGTYID